MFVKFSNVLVLPDPEAQIRVVIYFDCWCREK